MMSCCSILIYQIKLLFMIIVLTNDSFFILFSNWCFVMIVDKNGVVGIRYVE